jgi:hypothetical protein
VWAYVCVCEERGENIEGKELKRRSQGLDPREKTSPPVSLQGGQITLHTHTAQPY